MDDRLHVKVLESSRDFQFEYRTFRFNQVQTMDQEHDIHCELLLDVVPKATETISNCTCYDEESCNNGVWSAWSECDGTCKRRRVRNEGASGEETEEEKCPGLCYLEVSNNIDTELETCSIQNGRSFWSDQQPHKRIMNGASAFEGTLPYVVRLTFQTFDQFYSDSQNYHLCAGTVIDKYWILTAATCCRNQIVTIKFNDYSVFYTDDQEREILSTHFHVHPDLDACLIRTAPDISEIVEKIPCINDNLNITNYEGARCWNAGWGSEAIDGDWATNLETIGVNLLGKINCQFRSFWSNLFENEICAVGAPTKETNVNDYGFHVVSGGKETCGGDFGAPLLCDIDGINTLVGLNSRGYTECGIEGYPAIHIELNSIHAWLQEKITNESGLIWTNWSRCTETCTQTRTRSKYEFDERECIGVCFKHAPDNIDESLTLCSLPDVTDVNNQEDYRKKRDAVRQNRMMGGQKVVEGSMPYVARLIFDPYNTLRTDMDENLYQQCSGTVIHPHFILTSRFCCSADDKVTIMLNEYTIQKNDDGTFNFDNAIFSNTFYYHPRLDACLIRVEADMKTDFGINDIPCMPDNIDDIDEHNGAACWNAGWGVDQYNELYSDDMQSIGLNLMSRSYCTDHSFWEVEYAYMCGGLPPNPTTPMKGWKHVTAGGKETCHGDYGAPLVCDIDGTAILIGINSLGDLNECGLDGKPAIHVNVRYITYWMSHVIKHHGPPKICFEFITDMTIPGALGDAIQVYQNGNPITNPDGSIQNALNAQQKSNSICIWQAYDGDRFRFVNGGSDNVSLNFLLVRKIRKTFRCNLNNHVLGLYQRDFDKWSTQNIRSILG